MDWSGAAGIPARRFRFVPTVRRECNHVLRSVELRYWLLRPQAPRDEGIATAAFTVHVDPGSVTLRTIPI